eukprot:CAMPEP_0181362106 /NCGR_PEP_ID=MMETSP1106-20121128/7770_1 /TAXON_ID=81844 /ORGANISM="Mantoniella antarctica, Strain SL-175" /LENGTH=49 /DNA_ID= /DNA_START= /DNA_END= /DNA_ORIENTATION=
MRPRKGEGTPRDASFLQCWPLVCDSAVDRGGLEGYRRLHEHTAVDGGAG